MKNYLTTETFSHNIVLGIFGGCLSLFLPETLGHELPQTLADGEEFGRGQGMWDFPCCVKRVDDDEETNCERFTRSANSLGVVSMTGASLRASSRGEIRSSMLMRSSMRSRYSFRSMNSINTRL